MIHYAQKHRSRLYHLITNLHVPDENKLARLDCCGVALTGILVVALFGFARLLLLPR